MFDPGADTPELNDGCTMMGSMRVLVGVLLLAAGLAACGGQHEQAGCGLADPASVTALAGTHPTVTMTGSVADLTGHGETLRCITSTGARAVGIQAFRHPQPMPYPRRRCEEGWIYAGTPDHYAPACQVRDGKGGTTLLLDRVGDYVITVTVRRPDHDWAGDAEHALVLADQVGARLR